MRRPVYLAGRLWLLGVAMLLAGSHAFAASAPRISTDALNARLGEAGLVVLDARAHGGYENSDVKIKGAQRVDPRNVGSWADTYDKEQTLVVYCS